MQNRLPFIPSRRAIPSSPMQKEKDAGPREELDATPSMSEHLPPLPEDDPELERDFQEWAQLLLDVYLWKLQQEREKGSNLLG